MADPVPPSVPSNRMSVNDDTTITTRHQSPPAATDTRCRSCRRLLAKKIATHGYEIRRRGDVVAVVRVGDLHCVCGTVTTVRHADTYER